MSASALAIQKNNEQSSTRLSRELRAELEDDLTKMKRQYQGLLMNMEEQKRKRMNQTRVIRNIRERIKEIEGGLKYINQKLGKEGRMITIPVRNGQLDKALKKFKNVMYQTRTLQRHIDSLNFVKPSDERRAKRARAKYRQKIKQKTER